MRGRRRRDGPKIPRAVVQEEGGAGGLELAPLLRRKSKERRDAASLKRERARASESKTMPKRQTKFLSRVRLQIG